MFTKLSSIVLSIAVSVSAAYAISTSGFVSNEIPATTNEFSNILPTEDHPKLLYSIQMALTDMHLAGYDITEEISSNIFEDFISYLDPENMYVTSKDYLYLSKYKADLTSNIQEGDLSFPYSAFSLIEQEKEIMFNEMLNYVNSLNQDELQIGTTISKRTKKSQRFSTKEERLEFWKLIYQAKILTLMSEGSSFFEAKNELITLISNQIKYFEHADSEDIFAYFANILMGNIEAHTRYDSPINARQAEEMTNNKLVGIGAQLTVADFFITITKVYPESPAEDSGALNAGDRIIAVQPDKNSEWVPVTGMRLTKVTDIIKGDEDSVVTLKIAKKGKSITDTANVEIIRKPIKLLEQTVKFKVYDAAYNPQSHAVGIITVPSFYSGVGDDTAMAIEELTKQNVESIILDLRNNGGGLLLEAQSVASLFLEEGSVVKTRGVNNEVRTLDDLALPLEYRGNLTVLVNRNSASASEIVAGAIQDHNRGIIIGETTFGKGTVQSYFSLEGFRKFFEFSSEDFGSIAITQAKFYRPSGGSTQHKGVTPDIQIYGDLDANTWGESTFDSALPWDELDVTDFHPHKDFSKADLEDVRRNSGERIQNDENMKFIIDELSSNPKTHAFTLDIDSIRAKREEHNKAYLDQLNRRLNLLNMTPIEDINDLDDDIDIDGADIALDEAVRITNDILIRNSL